MLGIGFSLLCSLMFEDFLNLPSFSCCSLERRKSVSPPNYFLMLEFLHDYGMSILTWLLAFLIVVVKVLRVFFSVGFFLLPPSLALFTTSVALLEVSLDRPPCRLLFIPACGKRPKVGCRSSLN